MGNDFCNCNFLDNEEKKEENIASIQNQHLSILSGKKAFANKKHIFYLKSSKVELPFNLKLDNNPSIKLKQIYIINRIKFLSKKIREFLHRKRVTMTTGSVVTTNNDNNNRLITILSTNRKNYIVTDTGEIAHKNLSMINDQNYKSRYILKHFDVYDGYGENDGIIYIKMSDNSVLKGIFCNNALNGFSLVSYINKDTYKGELYNDKANGYGIYYFSRQGCAYEGFWEDNYKTGIGVENWWYEAVYEGEFRNGKKNGIGTYKWKDNSIYTGEWYNNNIHGFGIFKNKTKKKYKGQFVMNSLNGYGEMTNYKNKSFYYGFWKENKKNGFGVELSPRKDEGDKIYSGFWEKNDRHGYGILLNKNNKERDIYAIWKKNKISKQFYTLEEFIQSLKQIGLEKYLFFFERKFDEHMIIINNINTHGD